MILRTRSLPVLVAALLLFVAATQAADPEVAEVQPQPGPARSVLGFMTEEQAARLKPLFREINEVLVEQRLEIQALEARLASITDPIAALGVQRDISGIKEHTEIRLLEVQAKYARIDGHVDQASEIDAVVEEMRARLREPNQEQ